MLMEKKCSVNGTKNKPTNKKQKKKKDRPVVPDTRVLQVYKEIKKLIIKHKKWQMVMRQMV